MIYCKNCGTKLTDGAKFCVNCGAKTKQDQPATVSKPTPSNEKVAKKKKPIHKRWWFWVMIVFLVLALLPTKEVPEKNDINTMSGDTTSGTYETSSELIDDSSSIEREILFRDIPWGSDSFSAKESMEQSGITSNFVWKNMNMPSVEHLFVIDFYSSVPNAGNTAYFYDFEVAGHKVSQACMNFMYKVENGIVDRNTDELYSAVYTLDVADHQTVYDSLKQKLTDLYGEGEESESSRKGLILAGDYSGGYKYKILETTWNGANDTFVTLRWTSNTNDAASVQQECGIMIAYGKSDADKKLDALREAIDEEKKKEDRDKSQSGNNAGL